MPSIDAKPLRDSDLLLSVFTIGSGSEVLIFGSAEISGGGGETLMDFSYNFLILAWFFFYLTAISSCLLSM